MNKQSTQRIDRGLVAWHQLQYFADAPGVQYNVHYSYTVAMTARVRDEVLFLINILDFQYCILNNTALLVTR